MINTAIKAAILAAQEIMKIYDDPSSDFSIEKKADHSPLTIADKASHHVIEKLLLETNIPILSEEGIAIDFEERKHWDKFWLVDPLDGTKEFIKKNNEFTVNIALIEKGQPTAGIIYVPVTNELYVGIQTQGAWKMKTKNEISFSEMKEKGVQLPVSNKLKNYTVVGSRSHRSRETQDYIKMLKKEHAPIEIVSIGSSLKIAMVAEGLANEYPRFGPTMEWDTAAGHAIANAVGKKLWLTDMSGELKYNKENLLNPFFIVK